MPSSGNTDSPGYGVTDHSLSWGTPSSIRLRVQADASRDTREYQ
jgi:hypothetical protein